MEDKGFSGEIVSITNEVLSDGTVENIMRDKITKGFEDAIENAFQWGDLRKAIESRVKQVLVPYVEKYDMSDYVVKLDEMLSQIVSQTALVDNKRILENFRNLMVEPQEKTITLEKLFRRYCKYVAENVDTSKLEVEFDDGPSYEYVDAVAEIESHDDPRFASSFSHAELRLDVEGQEELSFVVRLMRWDGDKEDGYRINFDASPTITGLSHMGDFEVLLSALTRAQVHLVWDEDALSEEVQPDAEPEASFD